MTLCKYSERSDHDCGCANRQSYRLCKNETRLASLDDRTDGAAFHKSEKDGAVYVREDFCNETHCVDFEPMNPCKYATETKQRWAGNVANCFVVECHNPETPGNLRSFKSANGVDLNGVRRACDEKFNLIPNADYLHVRSRFCNHEYCPYFTEDKENSSNVE